MFDTFDVIHLISDIMLYVYTIIFYFQQLTLTEFRILTNTINFVNLMKTLFIFLIIT